MAYQYRPPYPPPPPAIGQGHGYQHPHPTPPGDPFRAYYADRLRQLTFNSRPLIQELSVMAMQQRDGHSREGMRAVVESIESAVLQAPPQAKLPLLYLIDSISKNVGSPYTTEFLPPIIPRLYTKTYREVDGHTKSRMDEVIKLWGHTGPNNSPLYGPGIKEAVTSQIYGSNHNTVPTPGGHIGPSRQQVLDLLHSTLAAKHREVQFNPAVHGQLAILSQIGDVVNTQNVSSLELGQIMEQLKSMMPPAHAPPPSNPYPPPNQYGPVPTTIRPPFPPNGASPFPPNVPSPALPPFPPNNNYNGYRSTPPPNPSHLGPNQSYPPPQIRETTPQPPVSSGAPLPLDVAKLLQTINAGSLSQNRTPEPKSAMDAYEELILGMNVKLVISEINTPRSLPHAQLPDRCRNCGIRMPHDEDKMKAHMDWHFRRNRKEREGQGRGAHRKWLPKADEWANEVPQAGPSKAGGRDSTPGSGPKLTAAKLASLKKRYVGVPQDPIKKSRPCPVCKEVFKPEWAEEHEEWVYWNAVDINGTIYHATCRAEQMSLTKLMKEEGKRSKSASPKVTPGPDTAHPTKVEKRKPENEVDEEELSKRARMSEQQDSVPAPNHSQNGDEHPRDAASDPASIAPQVLDPASEQQGDLSEYVAVKQEKAGEEADIGSADTGAGAEAVESVVKMEPVQ